MRRHILFALIIIIGAMSGNLQAQNDSPKQISNKKILGYIFSSKKFIPEKDIVISIPLTSSYTKLFEQTPSDFEWRIKGLPTGAVFDYDRLEIIWSAKNKPLGRYKIKIEVRYKDKTDSKKFELYINDDKEAGFLPAVGFSFYSPKTDDVVGRFSGISVQYALYSWVHRNDNSGPCIGQWYISTDFLASDKKDVESCFIYGTGVDLSFERNPKRKWLLPYFGAFFGWMNQADIRHRIVIAPDVGIWFYADLNLFVNAKVSYLLPVTKFDEFKGLKATLSVNFSMW